MSSNRELAAGIAHVIKSSNMRQLTRIYRQCSTKCSMPIKCVFGQASIMYKIVGNYTLSSSSDFNTIITCTEDLTFILYVTVRTIVTVALQSDPTNVIFNFDQVKNPGTYTFPAGYQGLVVKIYANIPSC
jgi:hypothetical protein